MSEMDEGPGGMEDEGGMGGDVGGSDEEGGMGGTEGDMGGGGMDDEEMGGGAPHAPLFGREAERIERHERGACDGPPHRSRRPGRPRPARQPRPVRVRRAAARARLR